MNEKISPGLAKLFMQAERGRIDLWVEHQALLAVLRNAMPYLPPEVRQEFLKYEENKKRILDGYLMGVEKKDPSFAARLDEQTPLIQTKPKAGE